MTSVATTCPYCGVGCGLRVTRAPDDTIQVAGDPNHPANAGRLCSKGAALADTLGPEDRLLYPEIGSQRVSWDMALAIVADSLRRTVERHGPGAIAFYVSGQLLTEDYYVANKLIKGFLGSSNIDTNSRLCMASAVAGYQRAFGEDLVPNSYEDLDIADLVVIVGANSAWCHPVVFQRLQRAKEARPQLQIVNIDPRRTATSELADLQLSLRPGTDAVLFNGLLNYLRLADRLDLEYMEQHVDGYGAALTAARNAAPSIPAVAAACGLAEVDVARFYQGFAGTERVVTLFSQGINQSSNGTDRVNSIINCHLASGRIGRPGMGPFSLTGQPNAMGGREVGGLANQLAAHMGFTPTTTDRLARFWGSTRVATQPGLKAVDMFRAIERGEIKAVWIMATNPAVSMPDADRVRAALKQCELVIVSDCVRQTDTVDCAHIVLPAAGWGEKDGTVTNSERRISRQRRFMAPPGEARPDWWIITQVAQRLGWAAQFPYAQPADIFREHARLSGFENDGARVFDISALADITNLAYDALTPVQWPVTTQAPTGTARLFDQGRFPTSSGRAQMIAIAVRGPAQPPTDDYPLILNTGRIRDQWHTMTRTARAPRLNAHISEPYIEIHPDDAVRAELVADDLARVTTPYGEMLARVQVSERQRRGSIFVPFHWSDSVARLAKADALVNPVTDPISGQPEFKHTPARVAPYRPLWHGFLLIREPLRLDGCQYRVQVKGQGYWRYEIAGEQLPPSWRQQARAWFGADGEWLELEDVTAGRYRAARIDRQQLTGCLFIGPSARLPARAWLESLMASNSLGADQRLGLLSGRAPLGTRTEGSIICACFGVGRARILDAIRSGCATSQAVGVRVQAGTNCGSCLPEIRALIAAVAAPAYTT
ncbi:MAG: molybdopterin-dependent oxidoreductase [Gammaproteobacteria bacterium]|nr:molybdopterin-dependent oxidoreductase [Gammaproteobacteria bacterium]